MPGPTETRELEAFVGRWRFANAKPDADLAGTVVQYWEVEGSLAPFREKVVPNGCLELMIDLGPPHLLIQGRKRTRWDRSWFSGLHQRSIEIQSEHGTHLVSARLTPLGAWRLFGAAAPAAANKVVDLEDLAGPTAAVLRDELLASSASETRFELLERFLRTRLADGSPPSSFVFPQKLETANGIVEMKSVWTRPDSDSYRVWVGQKNGAEWKVMWTMYLKRRG